MKFCQDLFIKKLEISEIQNLRTFRGFRGTKGIRGTELRYSQPSIPSSALIPFLRF